uniref:Retrotransposon Copia-like N-terminal domain-containing protein n=1 Tax=Solanum tuberosum TaxID=4113 RepID=M1DFH5_SOLTU
MTNGSAIEGASTGNGVISPFPVIDHNHPLFLQRTPDNSMISLQLIGSVNYALWSRSFKIGPGTMPFAEYHSRLRDLLREYDALMPCPNCLCPWSKKFGETKIREKSGPLSRQSRPGAARAAAPQRDKSAQ